MNTIKINVCVSVSWSPLTIYCDYFDILTISIDELQLILTTELLLYFLMSPCAVLVLVEFASLKFSLIDLNIKRKKNCVGFL